MHYYNFNIGDYRRDTNHLSLVEHAVYRILIDWYYLDEKPIPTETQSVIRRLRLVSQTEIDALNSVLSDFFVLEHDGWHHTRIDADLRSYQHRWEVNRENGKLGGRPKKTQSVNLGNPTETQTKGNHKPTTINQQPNKQHKLPPDGVSESVWADFVLLRRQKKAAITETAMKGIAREAGKAGVTLEAALIVCCERNWTSFKADWVAAKTVETETAYQKSQRLRFERLTGRTKPEEKVVQGEILTLKG